MINFNSAKIFFEKSIQVNMNIKFFKLEYVFKILKKLLGYLSENS